MNNVKDALDAYRRETAYKTAEYIENKIKEGIKLETLVEEFKNNLKSKRRGPSKYNLEVKELVIQYRNEGKSGRSLMTDAVKEYKNRHSTVTVTAPKTPMKK